VGIERIPETQAVDPELFTSLAMIGADTVQSDLGFTGAGIKVAVVDTGIDYDHPDLGGCFGAGCRVATGYDFVGDAYNADPTSPSYNPVPTPDDDPDDCAGHGTHVSGIIGANGTVTGVAPGVTYGAYRIFGCGGSANDDVILLALERAYADGMDVINMSLGEAFTWPQYPLAQASDDLVNHGIVVVASIGNSGAEGLYSAGAPGLGKKVIGVASYDNSHVLLNFFTVNGTNIGYIPMTGAANPPTSGTEEIVFIGQACNTDALVADPAGKVALAVRGVCSFREKALKAIAAGATKVVIYNSTPGVFSGTVGAPALSTPVVGISQADGVFIRNQATPISMTWTNQQGSFPSPTGGLISSFSSYGLSPDLALKPDIGAPGGNIYSTFPLELGGYATLSGTSMASPHVAGAAALYLEAHPGTSPQDMRDILQNSADPKNWSGSPGLGFLDLVHRQGAGMLDIDDSILATTLIKPGKISAGESQAGPFTQTLTLQNSGGSGVTYDLSYVDAISTGGVIAPSFFDSDASVSFSAPSVSIPAGGTANVNATINPATYPVNGQYGGYVVFTPQGGGQVYRVPFAGFVGDYQGIQVLTPTASGFPWLARLNAAGTSLSKQLAGATFNMQGNDIPYFLVHFNHQARTFRVEIFAAGSNKAWHRAFNQEYLPRNTTNGFFAYPFDGTTFVGNKTYTVPDGTYYAVVSVLKANGDSNNPAHWETWTSPNFVVGRP
jgi:subtilisin family serine protease